MTRFRFSLSIGATALISGLMGCASTATPAFAVTPASLPSVRPCDAAIADAIGAYLQTFSLSERDLAAGLTIPWTCEAFTEQRVGAATATGRTGPQGHAIFALTAVTYNRGTVPAGEWFEDLAEIAPTRRPAPQSAPARPVSATLAAPVSPRAESPCDAAIVESIRAFLHMFNLSERELAAGLAIPWRCQALAEQRVGAASPTGRKGPQGHQVYALTAATFSRGTVPAGEWFDELMEIAPTPLPPPAADRSIPLAVPTAREDSSCDAAIVASVRAYLRTFRLNEQDLPRGLAIPWRCEALAERRFGAASATGRNGPKGHQVYVLSAATYNRGTVPAGEWFEALMEIAP
jgi:hypothetical protein